MVVGLLLLTLPVLARAAALDLKTADAVYQVIEKTYRVNRDGSYTLTLHVKTKILTYKGKKDHADFKYPYNSAYQSVKILKAQTMDGRGKVMPVDAKEIHDINDPQDARASIYSREHVKVVNFPSVEPGTTVEMTLRLKSKRGFWATENFRLGDPILLKVVTVSLPGEMALRVRRPALKVQEKKVRKGSREIYRWTAKDIPRQVEEPMLPPRENRGTCLFLSTFSSWTQVAGYFKAILPDVTLKQGGKGFPGKSPDELYIHFMKHFAIYPLRFFHTSLAFQSPETTLRKGYGSQADLAILFYGLLKARGFSPGYLMMNSDGGMLRAFEDMPLPTLFDDVIVRCQGRDYAFYAKDLPPGFSGVEGQRVLDLRTGRLVSARRRYVNRSETRLSLIPTPAFTVAGVFMSRSEGEPAVSIRGLLKYETKDEWRITASQILHGMDPLAQPEGKITRKGLEILTAPVILKGRFTIPRPFPENGAWIFLTLKKPDLPGSLETLLETRTGPVMVAADYEESLKETVTLPAGVRVLRSPGSSEGTLRLMNWRFRVKVRKHHLMILREIRLKRGILFPGTEAYFRFIRAINTLYRPVGRLIVLERVTEK